MAVEREAKAVEHAQKAQALVGRARELLARMAHGRQSQAAGGQIHEPPQQHSPWQVRPNLRLGRCCWHVGSCTA